MGWDFNSSKVQSHIIFRLFFSKNNEFVSMAVPLFLYCLFLMSPCSFTRDAPVESEVFTSNSMKNCYVMFSLDMNRWCHQPRGCGRVLALDRSFTIRMPLHIVSISSEHLAVVRLLIHTD